MILRRRDILQALLEGLDALPDRRTDFRNPLGPEQQRDDGNQQQDMPNTEVS